MQFSKLSKRNQSRTKRPSILDHSFSNISHYFFSSRTKVLLQDQDNEVYEVEDDMLADSILGSLNLTRSNVKFTASTFLLKDVKQALHLLQSSAVLKGVLFDSVQVKALKQKSSRRFGKLPIQQSLETRSLPGKQIANLLQLYRGKLSYLSISRCYLTNDQLKYICRAIATNHTLKHISFGSMRMVSKEVVQICTSIKQRFEHRSSSDRSSQHQLTNKRLYLEFGWNWLCDASVVALTNMFPVPLCREEHAESRVRVALKLQCNNFSLFGVKMIFAKTMKHDAYRSVSLRNNLPKQPTEEIEQLCSMLQTCARHGPSTPELQM